MQNVLDATYDAHGEKAAAEPYLARSMRRDPATGQMKKIVVLVDPVTDEETYYADICKNGDMRPIKDFDPFAPLRSIAAGIVKMPLIEVMTPKEKLLPKGASGDAADAEREQADERRLLGAKAILAAIDAGESMRREWDVEQGKLIEGRHIGYQQAARRYGTRVDTLCPDTSAA